MIQELCVRINKEVWSNDENWNTRICNIYIASAGENQMSYVYLVIVYFPLLFFSDASRKFSQLLLFLHKNLITNNNKFYNNG